MTQLNPSRLKSKGGDASLRTMATASAIAIGVLVAACTPQDDQAAAGSGAVASDSANNTVRSTAGEAVERARQAGSTSTDAAAGAAASGSNAAAQSAQETLRKTEAQVKAADEKLDKAMEEAKRKIPRTATD